MIPATPVGRRPWRRSLPLAAYAAALLYLWLFVDRAWVPHDDGMLGQVAERVLAGELPHRDFDDPYTGLLGYLHGLSFLAFGTSILSMRLMLFAWSAAWLAAMYWVARRFVPAAAALLVTGLALAWTLPNYFAGVPSYYNLFLATFGMAALLRHTETGHRGWLALAGACGGISFLMKSAGGLYFAAAAVLFLAYREASPPRQTRPDSVSAGWTHNPLFYLEVAGALALVAVLARIAPRFALMEILHFVVPPGCLAMALCLYERRHGDRRFLARIGSLWAAAWPFATGFLLPVAVFLVPYLAAGAVAEFVNGVFVLPARRFDSASFPLPGPATLWPTAILAFALWALRARHAAPRRSAATAAALLAALALIVAAAGYDGVYQMLFNSARHAGVAAVVAGSIVLARCPPADPRARERMFLALAMAAFMGLLQIPFAAPIYFTYGAPFVILAIVAVLAARGIGWRHAAIGVAYLAFAVAWMNSSYLWALGSGHVPYSFVETPWVRRAKIRMLDHEAEEYTKLMQVVEKVHPTRTMLALPDCPEVYFLSGRPNRTRHVYEFLAPHPVDAQAIRELIASRRVGVLVINRNPFFSPKIDRTLLREFEARFPYSAEAGRFLIRWGL